MPLPSPPCLAGPLRCISVNDLLVHRSNDGHNAYDVCLDWRSPDAVLGQRGSWLSGGLIGVGDPEEHLPWVFRSRSPIKRRTRETFKGRMQQSVHHQLQVC